MLLLVLHVLNIYVLNHIIILYILLYIDKLVLCFILWYYCTIVLLYYVSSYICGLLYYFIIVLRYIIFVDYYIMILLYVITYFTFTQILVRFEPDPRLTFQNGAAGISYLICSDWSIHFSLIGHCRLTFYIVQHSPYYYE